MLLVILTGCNQAQTIEKSGGLRVIMSINPQELVHSLSLPNLHDPCFDEALQLASVRQETTKENYIDLFVEEYRKLDQETPLAAFSIRLNCGNRSHLKVQIPGLSLS